MSEKPMVRRWFQWRLITCVALMFLAGLLIWANVNPRFFRLVDRPRQGQTPPYDIEYTGYGWPLCANTREENGSYRSTVYFEDALLEGPVWFIFGLNAITGLLILTLAAVSIEYLMARRERNRSLR